MKRISFVIPLYNAAASVRELTTRIKKLRNFGQIEIIYVNDGSTDTTDAMVRTLTAKNKHITYIQLTRNFGQHNALLTGLRFAKGDVVICLDDDLQTPPEEANVLLNALQTQHADVVYGQYETNEDPVRRIGTRLHNLMAQAFGKPKGVTLTSFFCMKRAVALKIRRYRGSYVYLPALIFRATGNISSVPVAHVSRKYGSSGYTLFRLTKLWFIGVLAYLHLSDLCTRTPTATIADTINVP